MRTWTQARRSMRLAKAPYLCERVPGGRVVSPPVRSLVGGIRAGGLAAVRPIPVRTSAPPHAFRAVAVYRVAVAGPVAARGLSDRHVVPEKLLIPTQVLPEKSTAFFMQPR
jgi:hypothetical protein